MKGATTIIKTIAFSLAILVHSSLITLAHSEIVSDAGSADLFLPLNSHAGAPLAIDGSGRPLAIDGSGVPLAIDGSGRPLAIDGSGVPLAIDGSGRPLAIDGSGVPLAIDGSGRPLAIDGSGVPLAIDGSGRPLAIDGSGVPLAAYGLGRIIRDDSVRLLSQGAIESIDISNSKFRLLNQTYHFDSHTISSISRLPADSSLMILGRITQAGESQVIEVLRLMSPYVMGDSPVVLVGEITDVSRDVARFSIGRQVVSYAQLLSKTPRFVPAKGTMVYVVGTQPNNRGEILAELLQIE